MKFICIECDEPFEVKDLGLVEAIALQQLETDDCFACPDCLIIDEDGDYMQYCDNPRFYRTGLWTVEGLRMVFGKWVDGS